MRFRSFCSDLHLHTCLSPCGELEMTPRAIVKVCLEKKIDVVAVCDHNTGKNVEGVQRAAETTPLKILAGMEVTTAEEVHVLAIFDSIEQVLRLQEEVYKHLLPGENNEDLFGIQVVANEQDEVEGIEKRLLIGGTTLSINALVENIHNIGGLAIASHIDRESFSLVGQLGIIPTDLALDALEVSPWGKVDEVRSQIPHADRFPVITSSDAHRLAEIGRVNITFSLVEATVDEIRMGLHGLDGRRILKGGVST